MINRALRHRLFVNSASIFGGEVLARLATSLIALVIARWYGPVALGEYGYALALASVLLIVPDFGLHLFAVRELVTSPRRLPAIFWGVHWIKLSLTAIVILITLWISRSGMAAGATRTLLFLLIARVLLQTFSHASMAVFKAFERMHYVALQQLINSAVVFLWVAAGLALNAGVPVIVMGLAAGQLVETCTGWRIVRARFSPGRPGPWDWNVVREIAAGSFPIGITAVLVALNLRIDILVLRRYADSSTVGQFHAAASAALVAFVATSLLMAVLFPKLSRLLADASSQGSSYVLSLLKNGLLGSAAGALVVWVSAPALVAVLLGAEFEPAAQTLRILAPALPLIVLNTVLFYVFVAARRRFVYMGALAVGISAGVVLCFYLAPRYGAAGTAIADVVREAIVSGVYLCALARGTHARFAGRALLKVLVGSTALLAVTTVVTPPVLAQVWLAAWTLLVVAGTLLLLGLPRRAEWRLLTDNSL